MPCLPCMGFGYGYTPIFKDKPYALLAVAWGPLVETYVFRDIEQNEDLTAIMPDGFYFVAPGINSNISKKDDYSIDLSIQSLHWLD